MTLNSSLDIAIQGLATSSERLKTHANNIANLNTPNYQRKIPVVSENNEMSFETIMEGMRRDGVLKARITNVSGGVQYVGNVTDPTPGKRVYEPGHPEADDEGYVTYSNVSVLSDMSDAIMSQRLYEANLAVVTMTKAMAQRALEIGRGQ